VPNILVGSGPPLTVTVGTFSSDMGCCDAVLAEDGAEMMEKRLDVAYMSPCEELMKRRK
jgi:hypothetical protein